LEEKLSLLATLAQLAPLLGLLGTVVGVIQVFMKLQEAGLFAHVGMLSGGVWQALICAAAGLAVAIPTHAGYNYLVNRVNSIVLDMDPPAPRSSTSSLKPAEPKPHEIPPQRAHAAQPARFRPIRLGFFSAGDFCDARFAGLYTRRADSPSRYRRFARHGQTAHHSGGGLEWSIVLPESEDRSARTDRPFASGRGGFVRTLDARHPSTARRRPNATAPPATPPPPRSPPRAASAR